MICLDFDGVIADSLDMWLSIFHRSAAHFSVEIDKDAQPFRKLRPLTFEQLGDLLGVNPKNFAEQMAEFALAEVGVAPLFPGMEAAVAALSSLAPLAIVSSSRTPVIQRFVDQHGLNGFFSGVYGSGDGRKKGEILAELRKSGAYLMVGDAASDIDAARSAGLAALGVTWGWQDVEMLSHADMIVSRPEELFYAAVQLATAVELTKSGDPSTPPVRITAGTGREPDET